MFGSGKFFRVALLDGLFDVLIEFGGPRIRFVRVFPIHFVQIVNQVAAAEDQDAAVAHFLQFAPQREVLGKGARLIEAYLKHGDIRLRIHVAQDAPRAMIESPLGGWLLRERRERDTALRKAASENRRSRESCAAIRRQAPGCRA